MTPQLFEQWTDDMRTAGLARSDAACARLLGMHPNSVARMRRQGADHRTSVACMALLFRIGPYDPARAPLPGGRT